MENILQQINNLQNEDYKNSWSILKGLCEKALLIMSEEDVYKRDRTTLMEVINILNVTEKAEDGEYRFRVFSSKKEHAITGIKIYMEREKSIFKYSF